MIAYTFTLKILNINSEIMDNLYSYEECFEYVLILLIYLFRYIIALHHCVIWAVCIVGVDNNLSNIDVVIVSYNSAHVIGKAIKSVSGQGNVVVVDNASLDSSDKVARLLGAQVIENKKNLGFGVACNQGAALGRAEFILFLNPDAHLFEGALEQLINAAEHYPEAGGFVPRVLRKNGSQMFRNRSFLVQHTRGGKLFSWRRWKKPPQQDCELNVLQGAALFCRRVAFEQIGGFDRNIFLYFEDDDLSFRLQTAGWKLRHVHKAIVQHLGAAATSGKTKINFFKGYHWSIAQAYVAKKHGIFLFIRWEYLLMKAKMILAKFRNQKNKAEFFKGRAFGLILILRKNKYV